MTKFIYILRKYLWIISILGFLVGIIVATVQKADSSTVFAILLVGMIVTYIIFMLKPSKHKYAPNGKKWIRKYQYVNTTEETKSHKDGAYEIYYIHHFKVLCSTDDGQKDEYEIVRNGGVSGKDKTGKEYSKKIPYKLFLKNISALEEENR
jgi:hypothetical protein